MGGCCSKSKGERYEDLASASQSLILHDASPSLSDKHGSDDETRGEQPQAPTIVVEAPATAPETPPQNGNKVTIDDIGRACLVKSLR